MPGQHELPESLLRRAQAAREAVAAEQGGVVERALFPATPGMIPGGMVNNHVQELKAEVARLQTLVGELLARVNANDRRGERIEVLQQHHNENVTSMIRYQQQLVRAMERAGVPIPEPKD